MNAYHANKGGHMATIKKAVEDALLELLDEGKIIIKGPDGDEMEDLTVEMKLTEDDDYDSDDESSEDESGEDEDECAGRAHGVHHDDERAGGSGEGERREFTLGFASGRDGSDVANVADRVASS